MTGEDGTVKETRETDRLERAESLQTEAEAARRAALQKLGRLATWTAPAMLTLVVSPRASAFSEGPPDAPGPEG